jgi:hypothetical protein
MFKHTTKATILIALVILVSACGWAATALVLY